MKENPLMTFGGIVKIGIILLVATFGLSACSTTRWVTYRVTSNPSGAQVDVNNVFLGTTPTEIHLECGKQFIPYVGYVDAPTFYDVAVYPSSDQGGFSQSKRVNPCQWKGKNEPELRFDLGLRQMEPAREINVQQK